MVHAPGHDTGTDTDTNLFFGYPAVHLHIQSPTCFAASYPGSAQTATSGTDVAMCDRIQSRLGKDRTCLQRTRTMIARRRRKSIETQDEDSDKDTEPCALYSVRCEIIHPVCRMLYEEQRHPQNLQCDFVVYDDSKVTTTNIHTGEAISSRKAARS